ncbi:hypothetical protein Glo7428_1783 [Gloeocapsa sp. PCC 7428]|uniref:hypothetical protein n=1 Tax=Gloeocapsa sp. PCC 7428 TaxID=1173026 RepID=UPI0002A5FAE3|nr:hypothetical protein [Gloeocapsa sp. PCC 7428]AFZ30336.1 hypothetical protein Glo7428_1783 [Gloeocapsa sp. PCC 7428]
MISDEHLAKEFTTVVDRVYPKTGQWTVKRVWEDFVNYQLSTVNCYMSRQVGFSDRFY